MRRLLQYKTSLAALSGLLVLACASRLEATTIYVSKAGNDANNGLSWATAKATVQGGLNAASSGDQVWVAAGTYVENITLKDGVALHGGFAGDETDLPQRNWTAHVTILDGNKAGTVVTSPSDATANTRLDGFAIRNGQATNGGGMYCSNSSPNVSNCTFTDNTASNGDGGGMYCYYSNPTLTNCTFIGNSVSGVYNNYFHGGGGMYCYHSNPMLTNCTFTGNSASSSSYYLGNEGGDGGGVGCYCSSPTLTNCTFGDNTDFR